MNFLEAREELKKLADGRYRTLGYSVTEHESGTKEVECSVYVDGFDWYKASRWEEALQRLESAMFPERQIDVEIEDIVTL
jgi:hypothetical protein